MDNMHRPGNDIRSINNIGSYNECRDKCIEDEECYTWTHMEGTCYLKNENTFKGHGDNVKSGMKNCSGAGKTVIIYIQTYFVIIIIGHVKDNVSLFSHRRMPLKWIRLQWR